MLHAQYTSFGACGFREDFPVSPIISLWQNSLPLGCDQFGPQGHVCMIFKGNHKTLLYTKYKGFVVSEKIFFSCFFYFKLMRANDPQSGAIFDPSNMIGRIYLGYHLTLLQAKYAISSSYGFRDFFPIISLGQILTSQGCGQFGPQGHGRIFEGEYQILSNTKCRNSGPCGFREDFF